MIEGLERVLAFGSDKVDSLVFDHGWPIKLVLVLWIMAPVKWRRWNGVLYQTFSNSSTPAHCVNSVILWRLMRTHDTPYHVSHHVTLINFPLASKQYEPSVDINGSESNGRFWCQSTVDIEFDSRWTSVNRALAVFELGLFLRALCPASTGLHTALFTQRPARI